MDTRGLRHLKAYLGADGAKKAKAKRAADVVPVLAGRRLRSAAVTDHGVGAASPLSPSVMTYLEGRLSTGATHKLTRTQMSLVAALAAQTSATQDDGASPDTTTATATAPVTVTRGKVSPLSAMVDTVAVAALELASARTAHPPSPSSTPPPSSFELSSVFALTDDAAAVEAVSQQLETRYGLTVLRLTDAAAPRHPTFPSVGDAAKSKKAKERATPSSAETTAATAAVVVVVASPAGFLAVDRRSAIWKFVGAAAVLFGQPATQTDSLLSLLKGGNTATSVTSQSLNAQRWSCLGHVPNIALMAAEQAWLSAPYTDLLTTLSLEGGDAVPTDAMVAKAFTLSRRPVTVHYATAEGTQRFQFLFSLLKGLIPHRGLVVHVATRECATFLYDALYAFLDELPSYVQVLSDYEGASAYTGMHTAADRQRLCAAFDKTVEGGDGEKTAAVLISCYGLVPRRGTVFLQYDVIPDIANYNQFLAEVLTPGAVVEGDQDKSAPTAAGTVEVRREKTTRQRKRSVSPTPVPSSTRKASADKRTRKDAEEVSSTTASAAAKAVNYTHLLLLFRPNEVPSALKRLRKDGAARYQLSFHELPNHTGGRYLFVGEKLKSLNKKLFAIQNAAYYAYKATMRVYSTVGPRDVYDETQVSLEKVAAEFGYTELPLLDLRLKDTAFRPKEDFYRAARQKQEAERRAYKKFAKNNIIGEEPEEHVADASPHM